MNSISRFLDIRRSLLVKLLLWAVQSRIVLILLLLLSAAGVWLASWAFWYEPSSLTVKNYEINIPELSPAFDNFKIVAISDVHGGSSFITEEKIRRVVELANEQNADLIVLLGDYVSQQHFNRKVLKMPVATIADNLRGLRAKHGVFAVLGNHDWWYDDAKVRAELERVGYRVLENEAARIEHNGASLILLGLPDFLKAGRNLKPPIWENYAKDGREALGKIGAKEGETVIALTHNPDPFEFLNKENYGMPNNFRLMLAGHTHGGQCDFPIIGTPLTSSSYGTKYGKGLVAQNGRQIFVTPGIGTSILPVRFRVPPEISVLTISSR